MRVIDLIQEEQEVMFMSEFKFTIHTGDQYQAGTDSNIFVILIGALGKSSEVRLNGHISGNAFERDQIDECTIDFHETYDELGTIYGISVRSDMKYAGAGWLLDYIEVEEPTSSKKSKFKISEWIEDTNKHDYYDRSLIKVEDAEVKERNIKSEARYSVPANAKVSITDSTTVQIGYQMSKIKISEIDTKTSVSTELKFSKEGGKTFNLSQLVSTISFALETTNRTEEKADISHTIEKKVEQSITFPVIDKNQEYRPIYIENYEDCKIQVGNFVLEVPRILSRRGAGYEAI